MNTTTHRGETLNRIIEQKGISPQELADRLGKGRTTIWRWLCDADLPDRKVLLIADAIAEDVSKLFPEIEKLKHLDDRSTKEKSLDDNHFRGKYYDLLEKYNDLIEKHNIILEERAEYYTESGGKKK